MNKYPQLWRHPEMGVVITVLNEDQAFEAQCYGFVWCGEK